MKKGDSQGSVQALRPAGEAESRLLWRRFRQASTRDEFHESWLALQCQLIDGVTSGLLLLRGRRTGSWSAGARWPEDQHPGAHVRAGAERVLQAGRALALELDPQDGAASGKRTIIGQPIEIEGETSAVVVLDVTPRPQPDLEKAIRELAWGCGWLQLAALRESGGQAQATLLEILATPLEHAHFKASATAFVTELATRFSCERVSLGKVDKQRAKLVALSHSADFDKRSNLTRAIEAAMDEALDQEGEVVWTRAQESGVTRSHEALAAESNAGAIATFLIAREDEFCGAVTLERRPGESFSEAELDLVDAAVEMTGPILDLQRREGLPILSKNVGALRNWLHRLIGPRHVALKLVTGTLGFVFLFLVLAKGDYEVTADMALEARVMRAAVTPFDGYLLKAPVRAGDVVSEGDLLALLDDRDLALEKARYGAQLQELQRQYRQALGERDAPQVGILTARIQKVKAQYDLATDQLSRTHVVAPFDGIIVVGDLSQELGSPVERGDVLFEVAPLDDYRAILKVDEREIAEVEVGQRGALVFSAFPDAPVEFIVEKVTPVAEAQEGVNAFRVEARLEATPRGLRPGLEGVAKIEIDRRRLIWIWTHRGVDWLRMAAWTWLP